MSDGALDPVSEFVDDGIEGARPGHANSLRDDRFCPISLDVVEDGITIICLIGEDMAGIKGGQERDGELGIAGIAAGENESHRTAKAIDRDMPFARQSAIRAPKRLITALFLPLSGLCMCPDNSAVDH